MQIFLQEDNVDKYLNMVDHFGSDQDQKLGEKALEFAKDLIKGTLAHIEELDNTIQSHSKKLEIKQDCQGGTYNPKTLHL